MKAVATRLTKNDKGEVLFVPAGHHLITDWTILAINSALLFWLRARCTLNRLACAFFVGGDYANVGDGIRGSRGI
jgi:hypothetical protein